MAYLYGLGFNCRLGSSELKSQLEHTVGGWIPGIKSSFVKVMSPFFLDYFTDTVGSDYSPPISFDHIPKFYVPISASQSLASAGFYPLAKPCALYRQQPVTK